MKDYLAQVEKLRTDAAECALIRDLATDQAKRDLVFTSAKIKQIAYDLGFNDPAYFSRFFTKETGLTPRQYRARALVRR